MGSQRLMTFPPSVLERIADNTSRLRAPAGLANAQCNLSLIKRSVLEMASELPRKPCAVVVAGGPSLKRQNIIRRIRDLQDRPLLVCCEVALAGCLREEVVPDVIISLDPHPHRIVRCLGDPQFHQRPEDDYFQRQDLDVELREDGAVQNELIMRLVNRYGSRICAALATSVNRQVAERCVESGMSLFWWNPLYDDWSQQASYTRRVFDLTGGIPCLNGLGHSGGAAWVLAHAVLGYKRVGIVGMDLGYPEGTSVVNTQYYDVVRHLPKAQAEQLLVTVENPVTGARYLIDPVYCWYRDAFLDAVRQADCVTVNCSGEGNLFGDGIEWCELEEFTARPSSTPSTGATA